MVCDWKRDVVPEKGYKALKNVLEKTFVVDGGLRPLTHDVRLFFFGFELIGVDSEAEVDEG